MQTLAVERPATILLESGCVGLDFCCGALRGKGTVSAAGRLLTPTPAGLTAFPPNSCAWPVQYVPHTTSDIQTVFTILWKHPCWIDLSWLWQKSQLCWAKEVHTWLICHAGKPRKMFKVTEGIFRLCLTQILSLTTWVDYFDIQQQFRQITNPIGLDFSRPRQNTDTVRQQSCTSNQETLKHH